MARKKEIVNYAMSFKGKGMENEELKETIRLAIIDGAMWADETMIEKACEFIKKHHQDYSFWDSEEYELVFETDKFIEDFRKAMEE